METFLFILAALAFNSIFLGGLQAQPLPVTTENISDFENAGSGYVCYFNRTRKKSYIGFLKRGGRLEPGAIWLKESRTVRRRIRRRLIQRIRLSGGNVRELDLSQGNLSRLQRRYLRLLAAWRSCGNFTGAAPPPTPTATPHPPTAFAGEDQSVREGSLVRLSAGAHAAFPEAQWSYSWAQESGLPVEMSNPDAPVDHGNRTFRAKFTEPLTSIATLKFKLIVNDGFQNSAPVFTRIIVNEGEKICGDGVCGLGETPPECPWDCKIAVQSKAVKIEYPTYSTKDVTYYRSDGGREVITKAEDVRSFLLRTLDISIGGNVAALPGSLGEHDPMLPTLSYLQLNSIWSSYQTTLWNMIKDSEPAFVHAKNEPAGPPSRLLVRCCTSQYLLYPGEIWRQAYAEYARRFLNEHPAYDGIFMDNALGRLLVHNRYWRRVEDQPATVGPDGRTIALSDTQLHVQEKYYECSNTISAHDNPDKAGSDYFAGGTNTTSTITLGNPRPPGSVVYLSYWKIDSPSQEVIDSWPKDTAAAIDFIKSALGNKLLVYNGIVHSWQEDDSFPQITNGGMDEQFIFPPWAELPAGTMTLPESTWLKQVAELSAISKTRIYMAQSGLQMKLETPENEAKMRKIAMFAFASFLLGKEKYAYFNFTTLPGSYQHFAYFEYWAAPIGEPTGASFHLRGNYNGANIYQREFANALILVNPSDIAAPQTINLEPETYYTLSGNLVSSTVLESKTGQILLKTPFPSSH